MTSVAVQSTFDELGRPLRDLTFVVVDLETTGGSAEAGSSITEVGAVKVRHGDVLGEFQTLVRPLDKIPPFISVLTGITDMMVATAPPIEAVLPAFLEFSRGAVLVAHNAPFDVGFLKFYAKRMGLEWPRFEVLDTAKLARRVITRDDARDCKLSSLAKLFHASTVPNHRALSDARATVDVLHGLFERLGNLGVHTIEELQTFSSRVTAAQRRKRFMAEALPHAPGVYLFRDDRARVLYVGTSKDLRTRVRGYFTASETRSRMGEMVGIATSVEGITCATALEAEVRELRLIAEHKPRYNRRSKFPERQSWVKLTVEAWPRLSIVKNARDDQADYLGPFRSRKGAEDAIAALHESFPIRQCTTRLPKFPRGSACALAEMGRCLAPCDGSTTQERYGLAVEGVRRSIDHDASDMTAAIRFKMAQLAQREMFEEAVTHRNRLMTFVRAAAAFQRRRSLASCAELVAARRDDDGQWEVHVIRFGRLAAAGVIPGGVSARDWIDVLIASAETVLPRRGPLSAATSEESERILKWLERDGIRIVGIQGTWSCPIGGAESQRDLLDSTQIGRHALTPFDQPRETSIYTQPAR